MDLISRIDAGALMQALLVLGMTCLWFYCMSGVYINWRSKA